MTHEELKYLQEQGARLTPQQVEQLARELEGGRLPPEVREELLKALPPPEERARLYRELQQQGGLSIDQLIDPAAS